MAEREIIRNPDGETIAAACVNQPLTDKEREALAWLANKAREIQRQRDPNNLLADLQQRTRDRLWKRMTPECSWPGCDRVDLHDGRHMAADEIAELTAALRADQKERH